MNATNASFVVDGTEITLTTDAKSQLDIVYFVRTNGPEIRKSISWKDWCRQRNLTREQQQEFVRWLCARTLERSHVVSDGHYNLYKERPTSCGYWTHVLAVRAACKKFLPAETELATKLLLAAFARSRPNVLSEFVTDFCQAAHIRLLAKTHTIDDLLQYFTTLGCTREMVLACIEEFISNLVHDGKDSCYIVHFLTEIHRFDLRASSVLVDIVRKILIFETRSALMGKSFDTRSCNRFEALMSIARQFLHKDELTQFAHEHFVNGFALGFVSRSVFLLREMFRLEPRDVQKIIKRALWVAEYCYAEYGVACALAETLGETSEADRLYPLARQNNQKITFEPYPFGCES